MPASLGETIDKLLKQKESEIELSALEKRLFNWHLANLEYACAVNLKHVSLK